MRAHEERDDALDTLSLFGELISPVNPALYLQVAPELGGGRRVLQETCGPGYGRTHPQGERSIHVDESLGDCRSTGL